MLSNKKLNRIEAAKILGIHADVSEDELKKRYRELMRMTHPDEDFPLFLKSLYETAKKIIAKDDERKNINRTENITLMSDIAYLLSGQFFGTQAALDLMKRDDEDIYYAKTMLELDIGEKTPREGGFSSWSSIKS